MLQLKYQGVFFWGGGVEFDCYDRGWTGGASGIQPAVGVQSIGLPVFQSSGLSTRSLPLYPHTLLSEGRVSPVMLINMLVM